jgi:hypothetical protein
MRELIVRRYLCRGPVHRHAVSRRHCGTSQRAERHVLRLMAPAAVTLLCRTGHVQNWKFNQQSSNWKIDFGFSQRNLS